MVNVSARERITLHPPLGGSMSSLAKAFTGLAVLAFVIAVVTHFAGGGLLGTQAQAYSRASTNLALLAIALVVAGGDRVGAGRAL